MWKLSLALLATAIALLAQPAKYGVGQPATAQQIRDLSDAVGPDGTGLPEGSGTVAAGREVFAARCAKCHGEQAQGDIGPALVGGQGSLATAKPLKTVGSFWPYATTVWDYINGIIGNNDVMDAKSLPKVKMPNRDGFVADPRPDVGRKATR